ncbi:MAG: asparagine synthase-related protein [Candidatus Odinarchaeia archaeon]
MLESHPFFEYRMYYNNDICSRNINEIIKKGGFKEYSPEGITSFLSFRYPISKYTMFKNIFKIPNGEYYKDGTFYTRWTPKFNNNNISFSEAKKNVLKLLIKSINKIIQDKKIIGLTLSGGVDSSLLCGLLIKHFPKIELKTYSSGFTTEDEFVYSRMVAQKYSTDHKELVLNKEDYIGDKSILRNLIKNKGAPLHPNEIALALAERQAKKDGCQIVLCGEGADGIFGGYGQLLRMYINIADYSSFAEYFMHEYRYFRIEVAKSLVNSKYLTNDVKMVKDIFDHNKFEDKRNVVFNFIQKIHTPGLIIRGENALSYNGFKPGFPYINNELVNYVNDLPFDYKVRWNSPEAKKNAQQLNFREISELYDTPKYILKKIAESYLPEEVIYRKKYGFPVPFYDWFGELRTMDLDDEIFITNNIEHLSGWEKFMIINLNNFIDVYNKKRIR